MPQALNPDVMLLKLSALFQAFDRRPQKLAFEQQLLGTHWSVPGRLHCTYPSMARRQFSHTAATNWKCVLVAPQSLFGLRLPAQSVPQNCVSRGRQVSTLDAFLVLCLAKILSQTTI